MARTSMDRAVVVGAGIGGLSAAITLAGSGYEVTVLERAAKAGGKMRECEVDGAAIDSGPTVLTMRWVFDALFEAANTRLADHVSLTPLHVLARHAWSGDAQLDLFADVEASADAIGVFAGAANARGYRKFCAEARRMYETLLTPFLTASRPNPLSLTKRIGVTRLGDLLAIRPFETMWQALSVHFSDPRLRQLFGRYATYCGSSPFRAPATLMLIAHVEQAGVWGVSGGMQRLAEGLQSCAERLGVKFCFGAHASRIDVGKEGVCAVSLADGARVECPVVVFNGDPAALRAGLLGEDAQCAAPRASGAPSLSAVTWSVRTAARGLPLVRHNVFFSDDYAGEFRNLDAGALPCDPTIYVCAQDRADIPGAPREQERLLVLANAPAMCGSPSLSASELDQCETNMFQRLHRCGLDLTPTAMTRTTPAMFDALFPATRGALYGQATVGWAASFQRPGSRTRIPGLYLAGGGVHPGAGVPMTALSGQLAAASILEDRASTRPSPKGATPGGTSTRSALTGSTG